jgi:hypothetical protein
MRAFLKIVAADWPEDATLSMIGATVGLAPAESAALRDAYGDRTLRSLLA